MRMPRLLVLAATLALGVASPAAAKVFHVTTRADHELGKCTEADCTLREAVIAANQRAGADEIVLRGSSEPYKLTREGAAEDSGRKGDLDIGEAVEIRGESPSRAVIKQTEEDRVLEVTAATDDYVTLRTLTLTGGSLGPSAGSGGGIRTAGLLRLQRAVVRGNRAGGGGGGIATTGGSVATSQLLMRRSTVAGNVSGGPGGGIYLLGIDHDSEIEASTISGNDAGRGGGIWTNPDDGDLTIVNSTIAANTALAPDPESAPANGGGLYTVELTGATAAVRTEFTTIAGNQSLPGRAANVRSDLTLRPENTLIADPVGGVSCSGTTDSAGHNLDEGTSCDLDQGSDLTNSEAALEPLADNGGPTRTMALGPGSAAFSDGDCTPSFILPGFDLTVDQRGVDRPQGFDCDIGAYEGGAVAP